ncbi:MAG: hypothetical protein GY903_00660 [Fuerstiella sp.]|nr:hypothetical protein [Fuerstiella sp.]MCP4852988.1 hypothetical protein [Fuerstiella sp.]
MAGQWFAADKDGLRQLAERIVERDGFGIVGAELYQNVRDTNATECVVTIEKVPGKPRAIITVTDNGEGFADLTHAWMMFAPSAKKHDPTKAGRFNLGEKMVLSFAYAATVHTTSGTVEFSKDGRQEYPRRKRAIGTEFRAELACIEERYQQLLDFMHQLIVKPGLRLVVNGNVVPERKPVRTFETKLKTQIGDNLRPSTRTTNVELCEPVNGKPARLFELGIPVVETGVRWDVNVCQKVPLNIDRDNVTPAFLGSVRVAVLNEMYDVIDGADTETQWVNEAAGHTDCSDEAAVAFQVQKFGDKSVASDPNNREADGEAMSHGFTVIPSRGLSRGQRDNLKRAGSLKSSSRQFPNAGRNAYSNDPDAKPVNVLSTSEYSEGMTRVVDYTKFLATELLGKTIRVQIVECSGGGSWEACYGDSRLDFNLSALGTAWFERGFNDEANALILHEFGHEFTSDHLSAEYHDALCTLGAKFGRLVMERSADVKAFFPMPSMCSNA